jgi:hypothetical protein
MKQLVNVRWIDPAADKFVLEPINSTIGASVAVAETRNGEP